MYIALFREHRQERSLYMFSIDTGIEGLTVQYWNKLWGEQNANNEVMAGFAHTSLNSHGLRVVLSVWEIQVLPFRTLWNFLKRHF
jgi:hypothetical protein